MSLLLFPESPLEPGIIGVWQSHSDSTGSLTIAIPSTAGIAAGDILVAVGAYNNITTPTDLTGWSAWDAQQTISATTAALATKTADGTENGTNITFTSPTEGRKVLAIMAIRGAPGGGTLTADLHPAATVDAGGSTSTVASPTGSTSQANELVLDIFVVRGTGTHSLAEPSGYTLIQESGTVAASTNHGVAIARTAQGSTGSVGGLQLTDSLTLTGSVGWTLSFYTASSNQSKSATDTGTGTDASSLKVSLPRTDSGSAFSDTGARAYGTLVAAGQASGASTTISVTPSPAVSVGQVVVVWFSQQSTNRLMTVSDDSVGGNTWNVIQLADAGVDQSGVLAWCTVVNTFTTVTATSPANAGGRMAGAMVYPAGTFASSPGDLSAADPDGTGATSNSTTTGTPAQALEQIITFSVFTSTVFQTADNVTFDANQIPRDIRNHTATTISWHALAEQTINAASPVTTTTNWLGTNRSNVAVLSLKFPAAVTIKSATDSGAGTESTRHYYRATEAGTGADASIEKASLPRTDSATGADVSRSYRNRTDVASGADVSTEKASLPRSESGAGTETTRHYYRATDSGSGANTSAVRVPVSASDSATGADASTLRISLPRTESGAGAEITRSGRNRTENGTLLDASTLHVTLARIESGTTVDISRSYRNRTESGTGADASTEHAVFARTESANCTDSSKSLRYRTDSASGSELSSLSVHITRPEQGVGAELSTEAEHVVTLETGTINDVSALIVRVLGTDSAVGSDASTLHVSLPRTESGTAVDTSHSYRNRTDAGSATNGSFLHARYVSPEPATGTETTHHYYKATDASTGADVSTEHAVYSSIDSASGAENGSLGVPKIGTDTATSTDASVLHVALALAELPSGTDASNEHATFQILESGTATDTSNVSTFTQVRVNDSATGTDASSERAALSPTDAVVTNDSSLIHAVSLRGENGSTSENSSLHAAPVGTDAGSSSEATQSSRKGTEAAAGTDLSILHTILAAADSGAVADLGILHALLARVESAASTDTSHITFGKVPVFGTDIGSGSDSSLIPFVRHARFDTAAAFEAHFIHALLTRIDSARGFDRSTGGEPPPVTFSKMVIDLRTGNPLVWIAGKSTETSTYLDTKSGRLITPDKHSLMDFIDA